MDILFRDIFKIYPIYSGAVVNVKLHSGSPSNIGNILSCSQTDSFQFLLNFKESGPAGNTVGFQGGGNRQADGFLGAGDISDNKIACDRVKTAFDTFYRGIK